MTQLTLMEAINATLPAPVLLQRVDPERRMARFYRLTIEPTLFGGYALVREYGRIGQGGRVISQLYASTDDVVRAFEQVRQGKQRRGYA